MPLKLHFLNVGHGDCTFVELPSGRLMMIDINNSTSLPYEDEIALAREHALNHSEFKSLEIARWHLNPEHLVADQHVPDEAGPFLRASLYARTMDAAKPTNAAFPGNERRVNLDIRQAATDLDLNIGDANLHETSTIGGRRVPSTIVKLEYIA